MWGVVLAGLFACTTPQALPSAGQLPADTVLQRPREVLTSPWRVPPTDEVQRAARVLEGIVRTEGVDRDHAWKLTHALVALGPDLSLKDGTPVLEHLAATWGQRLGTNAWTFPLSDAAGPVEPHPALVLRVAAQSGVDPAASVTVEGQSASWGGLFRGALYDAWLADGSLGWGSWNNAPWAIQAIATWAPPRLTWRTPDGHDASIDGLTSSLVAELTTQSGGLVAMRERGGAFQKDRQGMFALTCGGAHFLQAAIYAVGRGFGSPEDRAAVTASVELLSWRVGEEVGLIDRTMQENPEYGVLLTVQRLKFLGHALESLHLAAAMGVVPENTEVRAVADRALAELVRTAVVIEASGMSSQMGRLKSDAEQTYLDLIGDSAHALHGLGLATGQRVVYR